jgi:4-diphosphocytidyl-2-C-methyl-D-erythritol kinase
MQERFDLLDGLDIELDKNIPISAGLGGGSSDAAATITTCNILFDLGLSSAQMAELGLQIGSDVPFFFSSGQAMVGGRGEVVTEVELPTDYWLGLVTPCVSISTASAYQELSLHLTKPKNPVSFRSCKELQELVEFLGRTRSDFESIQLKAHPQLEEIKNGLSDLGAVLTRMSGSGPTVFGLYIEAPELKSKRLQSQDDNRDGAWQAFAVRPIIQPA